MYNKEWYQKNKDKLKEYRKQYYKENKLKYKDHYEQNKHKYLEGIKQRTDTKRLNNREYFLHNAAKQRALKNNLEFSIDIEDITIPQKCPILGIDLIITVGHGKIDAAPSLDRVDSSKGYVKGNIQVISWKANRMKQDASKEELIAFAKGILNMYE